MAVSWVGEAPGLDVVQLSAKTFINLAMPGENAQK
jgi:hypothetical protein